MTDKPKRVSVEQDRIKALEAKVERLRSGEPAEFALHHENVSLRAEVERLREVVVLGKIEFDALVERNDERDAEIAQNKVLTLRHSADQVEIVKQIEKIRDLECFRLESTAEIERLKVELASPDPLDLGGDYVTKIEARLALADRIVVVATGVIAFMRQVERPFNPEERNLYTGLVGLLAKWKESAK